MVSRREFLAAGAALAATTTYDAGAQGAKAKPNILFILADDLGWGDLSCYGRPDYKTPVLDGLAARGVRLTQNYANSSTCSPTRVALITGRYQNRLPAGLYDPLPPKGPGLSPEHPTLPGILKSAGYATALVGKWHLGFPPAHHPLRSGYDEFFGLYGGGMTYFTHKSAGLFGPPQQHGLYEGDQPVTRDGYATDLFAERAIDFVRRVKDKPFFLSLHFTAPHWPWEGPNDKAKAESIREMAHYEGGSPRVFRTMMASLDGAIGRVLKALEGRTQDTLIVFTSDNGGERYSYQFPFRGEKGTLWEGGIRVPGIVVWPGVIPAGRVSGQLAMSMDWLPTLLAAAGARADAVYPPDGVDLLPVVTGRANEFGRDVYWRTQDMGVARSGDWKYVRWGEHEYLFNLTEDETENANFMLRNTREHERLKQAYASWDAQMLPVPADARRGAYEVYYNRARTLEGLRKK